MGSYVIKRLLSTVFVLLGVIVITFVITHVVPADPARIVAGLSATPAQVERIREELGLNAPLYVQFAKYLNSLLQLDLGRSSLSQRRVVADLALYLPPTLELVVASMLVILIFGVPLGVYCATHDGKWTATVTKTLAIVGMGLPFFWVGLMLQFIFYCKLRALPFGGRIDYFIPLPRRYSGLLLLDSVISGDWAALRNATLHLILPTATLAINRIGIFLRFTRAEMLKVLREDYVRTAHAKGLSRRSVVYKHALRNALIVVITYIALQTGWLLGGSVVVEEVFAWPGLGKYAFEAVTSFDFHPVMGVTLLMCSIFAILNLAADMMYLLLDPRIVYD